MSDRSLVERARDGDACADTDGRCLGCGIAIERVADGACNGCVVCCAWLYWYGSEDADEDDAA